MQLEKGQGLNIVVAPGTYSITAGSRELHQTHVVKVGAGQTASLDFHV